jgi:Flp pilus assembly protein TadG
MMVTRQFIGRFREATHGTIALVFALTIFAVILVVGLAIDGARAYGVSSRVLAALDAAALAAAKMLDDENNADSDIEVRARNFFAAQVNDTTMAGLQLAMPAVRIDRTLNEVEVSVDVTLTTTFGQLAGIDNFRFPRSSKVVYDMKRVELAMVLDITGSMCAPCDKIDALKLAAEDIVDTMLTSDAPYGYVRVGLVPYSASVNAGSYSGPVSAGASSDGCVVERSGAQAYTDAPASTLAPLGTSSSALNVQYSCPSAQILPLSADRIELRNAIRSLPTSGGTAGHIGLGWGWYLLSHNWADFWPLASRPKTPSPNVVKAVLLMTDGMFNTSYLPGPGLNSTDPLVPESAPNQAQRLCDGLRAQNIVVYAVAFQAPSEAEALLRSCVTSTAHFYAADNATDLRAAFREIGTRLTALRIRG